jgi:hypothetical protein
LGTLSCLHCKPEHVSVEYYVLTTTNSDVSGADVLICAAALVFKKKIRKIYYRNQSKLLFPSKLNNVFFFTFMFHLLLLFIYHCTSEMMRSEIFLAFMAKFLKPSKFTNVVGFGQEKIISLKERT